MADFAVRFFRKSIAGFCAVFRLARLHFAVAKRGGEVSPNPSEKKPP